MADAQHVFAAMCVISLLVISPPSVPIVRPVSAVSDGVAVTADRVGYMLAHSEELSGQNPICWKFSDLVEIGTVIGEYGRRCWLLCCAAKPAYIIDNSHL